MTLLWEGSCYQTATIALDLKNYSALVVYYVSGNVTSCNPYGQLIVPVDGYVVTFGDNDTLMKATYTISASSSGVDFNSGASSSHNVTLTRIYGLK